jgi:DNA repair exonuclease SbcCD nuclease subunit
VQRQVNRLVGTGIRVFIIPGNHDDVWYPGSVWLKCPLSNVTLFPEAIFTSESFQADGVTVHIHGVAYNNTICDNPLPTLMRDSDGLHIAMMHATIDPPPGFRVEQRYFPLSQQAVIQPGMDYVALGHIHRQRIFQEDNRTVACYPGSPEGLDPTETGDRHVAVLDFDGGPPTLKLLKVNKREIRTESVDATSASLKEIAERLALKASRDLLLTARLTGAPNEVPDVEYIRKQLEDDFFWLDIDDATEMVRAQWVENISTEHTIRGMFVKTLRERIEAADTTGERATLELALKLGLVALQKRSVS